MSNRKLYFTDDESDEMMLLLESPYEDFKREVSVWSSCFHKDRKPLGAMVLPYSNYAYIFESIHFYDEYKTTLLLNDLLDCHYPIYTLLKNDSNILHWISGSGMEIDSGEALTTIQRLIDSGFPFEDLDPAETPPCSAAVLALHLQKPNLFKLLVENYSEEGFERDREMLYKNLPSLESNQDPFGLVLAEKDAKILLKDVPEDIPRRFNLSRRL